MGTTADKIAKAVLAHERSGVTPLFCLSTYWPEFDGVRGGALRDELAYFASRALKGEAPAIGRPKDAARRRSRRRSPLRNQPVRA